MRYEILWTIPSRNKRKRNEKRLFVVINSGILRPGTSRRFDSITF